MRAFQNLRYVVAESEGSHPAIHRVITSDGFKIIPLELCLVSPIECSSTCIDKKGDIWAVWKALVLQVPVFEHLVCVKRKERERIAFEPSAQG